MGWVKFGDVSENVKLRSKYTEKEYNSNINLFNHCLYTVSHQKNHSHVSDQGTSTKG